MPDDEGEYDGSELETLKTLGGNTWDAELTKVVLRAATLYMQPWLREQADEVAAPQRVALRFAAIMNRVGLPARWALRRWRMTAVRGRWVLQRFRGAVDELITRMRALGTDGSSRARRADGSSDANDAAGDGEGATDDVDMDMGMSAGLAKLRAQGGVARGGARAKVGVSCLEVERQVSRIEGSQAAAEDVCVCARGGRGGSSGGCQLSRDASAAAGVRTADVEGCAVR